MAIIAMVALSGCKDTVKVDCPECTVRSIDGVKEIECTKCSIQAEFSEDVKLINRDRP